MIERDVLLDKLTDSKLRSLIQDHVKSGAINNRSKYTSYKIQLDQFHNIKFSANAGKYTINFCNKKVILANCISFPWSGVLVYYIFKNDKAIKQGRKTREELYDYLGKIKPFAEWLIWNQI